MSFLRLLYIHEGPRPWSPGVRRRRRPRYFPFFSFSFCLVSSILPHINHCVTRRLLMRHLFSAILSQQRENSVSIRRYKGRQNTGANSATGLERNSEIDCALTTRLGMVRRKCLVSYQRENFSLFIEQKNCRPRMGNLRVVSTTDAVAICLSSLTH